MMTRFLAIFSLVLIAACGADDGDTQISPDENAIASAAGFDSATAQLVRSHGESVSRLQGYDAEWEWVDMDGIVLATPAGGGEAALEELRDALEGTAYAAYMNEPGYGFGPDTIAVVKNTDPFAYLQMVRINGVNYDIQHEDVMQRLREWDDEYGLVLYGGGMDWLQAEFMTPPADWKAFATEVYEFCPDVVDQGTGSVKALAVELRKMNGVYLWWD